MKRLLAWLALLSGTAGVVLAAEADQPIIAVTPVFSQLVSYTLPSGFKPAFSDVNESAYIQEAVPAADSVENWSQMITMMGMKGMASGDQPLAAAAQTMLARYREACPDTLAAQSFGASEIDGRETLTVFLGCGTVATAQGSVSETAVIIFIKGQSDVYTLQWATHADAQPTAPDYDIAVWSPRMAQLLPIRICDRVDGEAAPYQSCIDKP